MARHTVCIKGLYDTAKGTTDMCLQLSVGCSLFAGVVLHVVWHNIVVLSILVKVCCLQKFWSVLHSHCVLPLNFGFSKALASARVYLDYQDLIALHLMPCCPANRLAINWGNTMYLAASARSSCAEGSVYCSFCEAASSASVPLLLGPRLSLQHVDISTLTYISRSLRRLASLAELSAASDHLCCA